MPGLTYAAASRIPSKDELRTGAESSLSHRCDPNNQPPPTPESSFINVTREDSVRSKSPDRVKVKEEDNTTAHTEPQRFNSLRRHAHRLRPKSWLPFTRSTQYSLYPRSISIQLPKTASTSTVARSVISAPILTSTTNVTVARTEGVHCGEISEAAFSQSTWNSQVGWVATEGQHSKEAPQTLSSGGAGLSPVAENQVSVDGARSKRGRMLRLRNTVSSKIRAGNPHSHITASQKQQTDGAEREGEHVGDPTLRRGFSRRAEMINLYKGKIKGLTANGHVRRKSVNNIQSTADAKDDEDPPLLGEFIDVPTTDIAAQHSDVESPFGSLTKSFASAVDKLDFYSTLPRNMSFLRSRSSLLNLKKGDKDSAMPKEAGQQSQPTPPPRPAPAPLLYPVVTEPPLNAATPTLGSNSRRRPAVPPTVPPTVPPHGVPQPSSAQDSRSSQHERKARQSGPSQMVFSNGKNGYVASAPVRDYPGGVNPLMMHPPNTMAVPPSAPDRSTSIMPGDKDSPWVEPQQQATAPTTDIDTDSESISLEDAPIYSPSLGDLSQYARDTPRSVNPALSEPNKGHIMISTPTRSPIKDHGQAKGQRGILKKSRSGVSLFSRSKADQASNLPGGPLSQRDANQKIGNDGGNVVKKSRSLHFGFFKKDERSDPPVSKMPSSPFQPATPSPLRKVMRYGSQSTKDGTSPTTLPGK